MALDLEPYSSLDLRNFRAERLQLGDRIAVGVTLQFSLRRFWHAASLDTNGLPTRIGAGTRWEVFRVSGATLAGPWSLADCTAHWKVHDETPRGLGDNARAGLSGCLLLLKPVTLGVHAVLAAFAARRPGEGVESCLITVFRNTTIQRL